MSVAPLVLTCGEPGGIGLEITLAAWAGHRSRLPPFVLIDAPERIAGFAPDIPLAIVAAPSEAAARFAAALPVLPLASPVHGRPGRPDSRDAAAVVEAIERAVALCLAGAAAAMVTNPIGKASLKAMGHDAPGHTELLARLSGAENAPVMMLASPLLRVVPITVHMPLAAVPRHLTSDLIMATARLTAGALRRDFALPKPRLAVLGLNPHAGEGGLLGSEEAQIIAPAIAALRAEGIDAFGPLVPDAAFHAAARARYDVALCMYHDQALIPLKTLDFDHGVNVTLGLPLVRTSPDHGTALDIAGRGLARPDSLIAALEMAAAMASARGAR